MLPFQWLRIRVLCLLMILMRSILVVDFRPLEPVAWLLRFLICMHLLRLLLVLKCHSVRECVVLIARLWFSGMLLLGQDPTANFGSSWEVHGEVDWFLPDQEWIFRADWPYRWISVDLWRFLVSESFWLRVSFRDQLWFHCYRRCVPRIWLMLARTGILSLEWRLLLRVFWVLDELSCRGQICCWNESGYCPCGIWFLGCQQESVTWLSGIFLARWKFQMVVAWNSIFQMVLWT